MCHRLLIHKESSNDSRLFSPVESLLVGTLAQTKYLPPDKSRKNRKNRDQHYLF